MGQDWFFLKCWRGKMAGRNYKQEGYHQGLEDGKKVRNKKEMGKTIKTLYSIYSPGNTLEYMEGYIEGFSESNMISIN